MGAKILINKLMNSNTLGMVSTHDLELGELEADSGGRLKNYHFREFYRDGKIFFDYQLRQGVSTTRNAAYLIRIAGIEI
jgi:DNA mismatch repair ATPase MutS